MKSFYLIFRILAILCLCLLCSCELLSDKNDRCDETKMDKTEEPVIRLKVGVYRTSELEELGKPDKIVIKGSIRKVYCSVKESGNFSYNPTYIIDDEMYKEAQRIGFILTVPKLFQYKFENTKDKLIVLCRVQLHWEDELIYESGEYFNEFFYEDIKYDSKELNHYITIKPGVNKYYQVTSE